MAASVWMKSNASGDFGQLLSTSAMSPDQRRGRDCCLSWPTAHSRSHGAARLGGRRVRWLVGAGVRLIGADRETRRSRWWRDASPGSPTASWAQSRSRKRWRRLPRPAPPSMRASGGAVEARARRLAARRTVLGLPLVISAMRRSYSVAPDIADDDVDQPAEDRACPSKIQMTRLPGRSARSRDQPRVRWRSRRSRARVALG
jgi:hypothetical protein